MRWVTWGTKERLLSDLATLSFRLALASIAAWWIAARLT